MNKISISLQDKDIINELAQDEQMQIRIKDAIIDGITKRAAKSMNVNVDIKNTVKEIAAAASAELARQFVTGDFYRKHLKEEWAKIIREQCIEEINTVVEEEFKENLEDIRQRLNDRLDEWKVTIERRLSEFDIKKAVEQVATLEIRRRLNRL